MRIVEPRLLKGFRDLLPDEMLAREKIINVIKEVYESYGFVPLSTPALEYKDTLLGYGDEANKQVYLFKDPDSYDVGLRYDLTVPLSRVIAQYRELPRPFKRYQIQPVWRYDKPDPGRFREFVQFDIDIVGTESMVADAEIISAMAECLTNLKVNFRIRFSHRKVLNSLIAYAGIKPSRSHTVFRVIDKLEKQGLENVKLELGPGRIDVSGDEIPGLGLDETQVAKIEDFVTLSRNSRAETINALRNLFKGVKGTAEGIDELEELHQSLSAMEIPDKVAAIDLSIARGLDYYTGPVYEAILTDKKAAGFGSVMGGGRYDNLIGEFTGEQVPATGASIGIDRLFSALQKLGLIEARPSTADVLVTVMDRERMVDYQNLARKLRREGIKTELYLGNAKSIGKQLKYADRQAIPLAVIIGSDEFSRNEVSIKDLRYIKSEKIDIKERDEWVRKKPGQRTIPMNDLISEIKTLLQ